MSGLTLSQYVRRRNGVPLGGSGSMRNMLYRSLGAATFAGFWRYWNPVWGYYLGRYVYSPLLKRLPRSGSVVMTFVMSGALHDAVASALLGRVIFTLTPWFFVMGMAVVIGQANGFNYSRFGWPVRALINTSQVALSYALISVSGI